MPPKALTESEASAFSQASRSEGPMATPQGLPCLTMTTAGSVN
jgi:hypothetical protein